LAPARISVSDSGEVILLSDTGKECFFKDGEHYSVAPRPGYDERDACPQISTWHVGDNKLNLVEDLGGHPQWISPEAAKALRDWNLSRIRGPKQ
jgi:hypothetical protein